MNTGTRQALDAVPVPVDEQGPVRVMVIVRDGAWRTAWGYDGCRRPEPFGDPYPTARAAADAARHLNER